MPFQARPEAGIGRFAACLLVVALLAGCTPGTGAGTGRSVLTVFAAASLRNVAPDLADAYSRAQQGTPLVFQFASSSVLRTQLEAGARADVLLSADELTVEQLRDRGLVADGHRPFARTPIVLAVPSARLRVVNSPLDLAGFGVRVVAAESAVPLARYTTQVVERLGTLPGYPAGFAQLVEANIVTREDSAASVVAKLELGEGDAAFVYASDVAGNSRLSSVELPAPAQLAATYVAAPLAAARAPAAAQAFVTWLTGYEAAVILHRHGFEPVR